MTTLQITLRLAALSLLLAPLAALHAADDKPNILIILADDLGWSDLGCYGGEIRTPNLDSLATSGLRFTQFYSCTRCCPSRASLLTGLYPHQAGIGLMTSDQAAKFPGAGDKGEAFPGYRGALNANCVTIAQVLKPAGYRTAAAGKWHVGDSEPPTKRGFDDFYGFVGGYGVDSWEPRMMTRLPEGRPQRSYKPGEFFATDAITDHALDFLAEMRQSGAPWLLYIGYQAPHFPVQSKREDMTGYSEIYAQGWDKIREQRLALQKQIGLLPESTALTPRSKIPHPVASKRLGSWTDDGNNPAWDSLPADRRADLAQRMAVYAGMVTGMDRNIGRLVADLRASGQLDNTLILFLSDNGACAEWEPFGFEMLPTPNPVPGTGVNQGTQALPNRLYRGDELAMMGQAGSFPSYGSGWANACNTPWCLYKHYGHEGGIGTPLIAHWPASVGKVRDNERFVREPAHLIDLMATCADIADAKYPAEWNGKEILPMEGVSLRTLLAPSASPDLMGSDPFMTEVEAKTPTISASIPVIRGSDPIKSTRLLAWEHEGNRAIREGKWKLVSLAAAPWELYDMDADRVEMNDIAASQPERVKDMSSKWEAWAKRTNVFPRPDASRAASPKP